MVCPNTSSNSVLLDICLIATFERFIQTFGANVPNHFAKDINIPHPMDTISIGSSIGVLSHMLLAIV
jgi:hypothetical protein